MVISPHFRLVVLANPPGWPFQGNDFFRECGDVFAAHAVANPDALSQAQLLPALLPVCLREKYGANRDRNAVRYAYQALIALVRLVRSNTDPSMDDTKSLVTQQVFRVLCAGLPCDWLGTKVLKDLLTLVADVVADPDPRCMLAVEGVLASSDLLPHVLGPLQLEDGAAAAVCSAWADGWQTASEGRPRLLEVPIDDDVPEELEHALRWYS